jgi:hypothetical protein
VSPASPSSVDKSALELPLWGRSRRVDRPRANDRSHGQVRGQGVRFRGSWSVLRPLVRVQGLIVIGAKASSGGPPAKVGNSTLCRRLSAGKGFWSCEAGCCGHASDLSRRRVGPQAIMPSARIGPRQHALDVLGRLGFSRSGSVNRLVALAPSALPNLFSAPR